GRDDEDIYQQLVGTLLSMEVDVPTAHISETGIEELDAREDPSDIYYRDVSWIEESDLLIAEVSTPSHGVGYEIGYALDLNKPVLCLYRQQVVISKMILGNPHPLLTVLSYKDLNEAEKLIRKYLSEIHDISQGSI
ncbi:MAG: nucleoside 2-deoxyribosyltransferase, partial [Anaerolineales bacterium]|nr:nucleoside 2-deoxyribosyltransferase [Anaerolineales bacterium]